MKLSTIVAGTDFSDEAEVAVEHALALAKRSGGSLTLAYALDLAAEDYGLPYFTSFPEAYADQAKVIRGQTDELLQAKLARFSGRGVEVTPLLVESSPTKGLVTAATEREADVLVVGSHGRTGLSRLLLGSVSETTVRDSPCDVLVARGKAPDAGYKKILVPTDFSILGDRAVEAAVALAAEGGEVEIFHCWRLPGGPVTYWGPYGKDLKTSIRDGAQEFGRKCVNKYARDGVALRFTEMEGDARHCIQSRAEEGDFDLISMGTHGRKGLQRLLVGSVAESTLRHAKRSVFLAR